MGPPDLDTMSGEGFSIGEAAAIVGVSTHVIRSWERRLALGLNHRTLSNQRRYWMEDIHRFIAIRRFHETDGLPLAESAARALAGQEPHAPPQIVGQQPAALDAYWAALSDALPDLLLVIDASGNIAAANESARARLNLQRRTRFIGLAPGGWRRTYRSLLREAGARRQSVTVAMRARGGIVFMDARVVPIRQGPEGPVVFIGKRIRVQASSVRVAVGLNAESA